MAHYFNEFDPGAAEWLRELMKAGVVVQGEVDERDIQDIAPDDIRGHRSVHLFAGIGVWSYALRLAGWPDNRPVWTCSCPCQPFSAAGKGDGFADERHLWPAAFHLLSECRPLVCFGEQVASDDGFAWLDLVQADLESVGYTVGTVVTPAAGYGAPHGRHRIYWVAESEGIGLGQRKQSRAIRKRHGAGRDGIGNGRSTGLMAFTDGRESGDGGVQRGGEHGQQPEDGGVGVAQGDTKGARPQGQRCFCGPTCEGRSRFVGLSGETLLGGFWSDAEWLHCAPEPDYPEGRWRPVEPGTFPLAHGVAGRVGLLRGYGNGLCAPQAAAFVRAWIEHRAA